MITSTIILSIFLGFGAAAGGDVEGIPLMPPLGSKIEDTFEDCLDDEAKLERVLARVATTNEGLKERQDRLFQAFLEFGAIEDRYDVTMADYRPVIEQLMEQWNQSYAYLLIQIFDLRAMLTDDEWAQCLSERDEQMEKYEEKLREAREDAEEEQQKRLEDFAEDHGE